MVKIKPINQDVQVMKLPIHQDIESNSTIYSKNKLFHANLPLEDGMTSNFFLV